jgi:hypothetical protein
MNSASLCGWSFSRPKRLSTGRVLADFLDRRCLVARQFGKVESQVAVLVRVQVVEHVAECEPAKLFNYSICFEVEFAGALLLKASNKRLNPRWNSTRREIQGIDSRCSRPARGRAKRFYELAGETGRCFTARGKRTPADSFACFGSEFETRCGGSGS